MAASLAPLQDWVRNTRAPGDETDDVFVDADSGEPAQLTTTDLLYSILSTVFEDENFGKATFPKVAAMIEEPNHKEHTSKIEKLERQLTSANAECEKTEKDLRETVLELSKQEVKLRTSAINNTTVSKLRLLTGKEEEKFALEEVEKKFKQLQKFQEVVMDKLGVKTGGTKDVADALVERLATCTIQELTIPEAGSNAPSGSGVGSSAPVEEPREEALTPNPLFQPTELPFPIKGDNMAPGNFGEENPSITNEFVVKGVTKNELDASLYLSARDQAAQAPFSRVIEHGDIEPAYEYGDETFDKYIRTKRRTPLPEFIKKWDEPGKDALGMLKYLLYAGGHALAYLNAARVTHFDTTINNFLVVEGEGPPETFCVSVDGGETTFKRPDPPAGMEPFRLELYDFEFAVGGDSKNPLLGTTSINVRDWGIPDKTISAGKFNSAYDPALFATTMLDLFSGGSLENDEVQNGITELKNKIDEKDGDILLSAIFKTEMRRKLYKFAILDKGEGDRRRWLLFGKLGNTKFDSATKLYQNFDKFSAADVLAPFQTEEQTTCEQPMQCASTKAIPYDLKVGNVSKAKKTGIEAMLEKLELPSV